MRDFAGYIIASTGYFERFSWVSERFMWNIDCMGILTDMSRYKAGSVTRQIFFVRLVKIFEHSLLHSTIDCTEEIYFVLVITVYLYCVQSNWIDHHCEKYTGPQEKYLAFMFACSRNACPVQCSKLSNAGR